MAVTGRGQVCKDMMQCEQQQSQTQLNTPYMLRGNTVLKVLPSSESIRQHEFISMAHSLARV